MPSKKRDKNEIKAEIKALKKEKKKIKKAKDPVLLEARKVLLNQVVLNKDGSFSAANERRIALWGAADGENRIRMFGVSQRLSYYETSLSDKKAVFRAGKAMANIGRAVKLSSDESAVACLVKTYIFYPAVLVFNIDDDGEPCLTVFTARTLTAGLAAALSRKKFEKSAEDFLTRMPTRDTFIDRLNESQYQKKHKDDEPSEDDYEDYDEIEVRTVGDEEEFVAEAELEEAEFEETEEFDEEVETEEEESEESEE